MSHHVRWEPPEGSLLNRSINACPNASMAGWYQLCSASMKTLTPRSSARVQICIRSLYSSLRSWISDSVSAPVGIEECRIERSDGEGVPGKSTGGSSCARVCVRYVDRLIKDWAFGSRAVSLTEIQVRLPECAPCRRSVCVHVAFPRSPDPPPPSRRLQQRN